MPTILDYLGLPIPGHVHGDSLRPYIEGREDLDRPAFSERSNNDANWVARSIRTREWRYNFAYLPEKGNSGRYVRCRPYELFNLIDDPGEERNLAEETKYRDIIKKLDDQLRQHLVDTDDPWVDKLPALT